MVAQARELNALVSNLLDMARLESGSAVNLRREWQSVEEVVGSAIRAAQPALDGAPVRTALPADLPLVEFDAVLIERVLVNLLENAAKYGAPPLVVGARATRRRCCCCGCATMAPACPQRCEATSTSCSTSSPAARSNRPRRASAWAWRSARPSSMPTAAASPRSTSDADPGRRREPLHGGRCRCGREPPVSRGREE